MSAEKEQKSLGNKLKEELFYTPDHLGEVLSDDQINSALSFSDGYKTFLDRCKTEREAVEYSIELATKKGFEEFKAGKKYTQGQKVYYNNRGKALILAVIGNEGLENGVNISAAHIDSPRLDLKPRPFYEQNDFAMLKTHYYGGIKKYQWTAIPLALHGVILKKDGDKIKVNIGEADTDPVFCISDLLPHLAGDQMKRTLNEGIKGEELNVIIGSLPFKDDSASEKVKLNILKLLNEKYGVTEKDFVTAELELVPAFKAKDLGFDTSMVGAYGQDDRVCAYTALMAALECENPQKTLLTVLTDKEEIGSEGNTGLKSAYLKYFIADISRPYGISEKTVLANSRCLSADVSAAFDPTFSDAFEKNNAAFLNYGVCLNKYTGSRGKGGTSDASAEYVNSVIRLFDKNNVIWQMNELGKVDQGGGGTVAAYIANLGVDVIDVGVPVLSMHSPFEITAKLDIYMTYKAFCVFANDK